MKPIKRDPLRFDVFNAFAEFSREERLSVTDPKATESFVRRIQSSVDTAMANEAFLYGQRTQAMFEALVISLGRVQMLKQEDSGEIYAVEESIRVPDVRLVLLDGKQLLVEVKNFYQGSEPLEPIELGEDYIDALCEYSKLMNCELRVAIYWVKWNQWTMVPMTAFKREAGKARLSLPDALMFNEMLILGDMMIGTKFPLSIVIGTRKDMPRTVESDGSVNFRIADIQIYCAGQHLTSEQERNIAWYLIMHGKWEEQEPEAIINSRQLDEIRFDWLPESYKEDPQKHDEQGFAVIGTLSEMFSRYYREVTTKEGQIGRFRIDVTPGLLGQLIPDDYKGEALPLWRFKVQPKHTE